MSSANELDFLKCILVAIETYRYQTSDYSDPINNKLANIYLKQHLSTEDWLIWQRLQADKMARREVVNLDTGPSSKAFKQLLGQYKRASYEFTQSWRQEIQID